MIGFLALAAACVLVAVGATAGVSLLPFRSSIDALLAWAVVASAIVVATVMLAGAALESLSAWLVLVLTAAAAAALSLAARASGRSLRSPLHRALGRVPEIAPALREDLWLAGLVVVACAELAWRTIIAVVMPPYAGDALWYHLTTVAGWIQAGRIGPSELSIWSTVHPQHGEVLFAWTAVLLGNDTLVDAVQIPFAVVGAVAVAGIGRSCGLASRPAAAAGCLFLLTPIVLSQTTASYTDLICIAFVLTAFHFLLRAIHAVLEGDIGGRVGSSFLLAGLAGGLGLGTKELAVPYMGVLAGLLIAALVAARSRNGTREAALLGWFAMFAIPLVVLGAYHYVETWIRFGNPAYPVRIAVFGVDVAGGRPLDQFLSTPPFEGAWWREIWGQWHADHFFLTHPRFHAYSYDGRPSGLGPLWSYLGVPALIAFAVRLAWRSRTLFLTVVVPVGLMFALQPYRWWSRFTMILAALGVIALMALAEALPARLSVALKAAVAVLVCFGIAFPTVKVDGEFWATQILSVARLPAGERTIGRIALSGYGWVDSVPRGAAIGVDTSARQLGGQPYVLAYPLFGSEFQHSVYPLPRTTAAAFREAVARREMTYVFVASGKLLDQWATRAMSRGCARRIFDGTVYAGERGRAYRIVPGCTWDDEGTG